jgi:hypothetical protein
VGLTGPEHRRKRGPCIVDLGSKRNPKSRSNLEIGNILDWEVVEPHDGRGASSGGMRA